MNHKFFQPSPFNISDTDSIFILDGGMGREIKRRLPDFNPILWSVSGLIHKPELVFEIHTDFINAGASVITTNNYAVVPKLLAQSGIDNQFESLTHLSGKLAKKAVSNSQHSVKIAGSIPPLSTSYRPDLVDVSDSSIQIYRQIGNILNDYVDIFLCESMSSLSEAQMAITALSAFQKPVWVSFVLDDAFPTTLLSKEPISQIQTVLSDLSYDGILFNCCHPNSALTALNHLDTTRVKGGYANSFTKLQSSTPHEHGKLRHCDLTMSSTAYLDYVIQWIQAGAQVIGGCCGIGPEYIQLISEYCCANQNNQKGS
jgi:S-methylmethionine-dependent homocysteine/selenocysteine methylase